MKICIICNTKLSGNQAKFCSPACKSKGHYNKHVKNNPNTSYSQFKRADERKRLLIQEMGGGCSICGYKNNYSALNFHHIGEKIFGVDSRMIGNSSMAKIREELKKCIVVCSNCHMEIHNPQCKLETN